MLDGFKKFILRGNVVDMAVGVVMGAAFGGVVTGLTKALISPLIKLAAGSEKFTGLEFRLGATTFPIDDFINATISFVLIALLVYFLVVLPVNTLMARMHKDAPVAAPSTRKCPECLSEIPIEARRCAHCTQLVMASVA
jgi:large conductance mechanosensitive channel